MSPFETGRKGIHGPSVWRALIILNALALAFAGAFVIPRLFAINHDAINATKALSCRLGGFFVGQPIVRQPQQSETQFQATIHQAEAFLRDLKANDCTASGVTILAIDKELRKLHRAGGGGASTANAPPSSPGGGRPAPQPAPRKPAPKPKPPPPRPQPKPGPIMRIIGRICDLVPPVCS